MEGITRRDAGSLSSQEALELYERDQILWMRSSVDAADFGVKRLREVYKHNSPAFKKKWHVENCGDQHPKSLSADAVLGPGPAPTSSSYYVSCILDEPVHALSDCLVPPELLQDAIHDDGAWLFIGPVLPSVLSGANQPLGHVRF